MNQSSPPADSHGPAPLLLEMIRSLWMRSVARQTDKGVDDLKFRRELRNLAIPLTQTTADLLMEVMLSTTGDESEAIRWFLIHAHRFHPQDLPDVSRSQKELSQAP